MSTNVAMPSGEAPGKGPSVRGMFASIAGRYDFANHLLSGGMDFLWRKRATKLIAATNPQRILDLATGSGDLALALQKNCPSAAVVGADFCEPMLEIARRKGVRETVEADAMSMPFATGEFCALTCAFGLRNMESWAGALREMARVLRPGGTLLILDFSVPPPPFRTPYRFYLHNILPRIAGIATGSPDAYRYLSDSIEMFPSGAAMCELITSAGFNSPRHIPLTFGIVSIYTATRS